MARLLSRQQRHHADYWDDRTGPEDEHPLDEFCAMCFDLRFELRDALFQPCLDLCDTLPRLLLQLRDALLEPY